jgi:hypothetical protein
MEDRGPSPVFEIAGILVCVDDVARFIVKAHDSIILTGAEFFEADGIADCI